MGINWHRPQTTDHRPQTHFKSFLLPDVNGLQKNYLVNMMINFSFTLSPRLIAPKRSNCSPLALPTSQTSSSISFVACTCFWLVGCCVWFSGREPSKAMTPSIRHPVQRYNTPHTLHPGCVSSLMPTHRRRQLSVGCCIPPLNGDHLRPRVRPSLYLFLLIINQFDDQSKNTASLHTLHPTSPTTTFVWLLGVIYKMVAI